MWIKDFFEREDNPLRFPPFVAVTHLCYSDTISVWEYPWHAHRNEFEVTFIMKGSGALLVDEKETAIRKGDICLVAPGTYHRYSVAEGGDMEYFALRFAREPEDGALQAYFFGLEPAAVTPSGGYFAYFQAAASQLLTIQVAQERELVQTITLPVLQLVQRLFANKALTIRTRGSYSAADIMRYITEHCAEKITLQSLGGRFSISPSHLSRMFSSAFHTSPINYLINARMARATEYLGKTDKPVSEIASLVGYDNQFYFVSLFTKRIGCSPTEYRDRLSSRDLPKTSSDIFPRAEETERPG